MIVTNDDGNHYEKVAVFSNEECVDKFDTWIKEVVRESYGAVEPKHGRWTSSQGLAEAGEVQCSNCKTIYYAEDLYNVGETDENGIGQALMPNHCPHCGAKMDEVEDDG